MLRRSTCCILLCLACSAPRTKLSYDAGVDAGPADASGCATDSDCSADAGLPRCDLFTNACVECLATADCPMPATCGTDDVCHAPEGECAQDSDCAGTADPRCDTNSHQCVPCLAGSDCATGHCSSANVCVRCLVNADCASTPATTYCDPGTYTCVDCTASSQCSPGDECVSGTCTEVMMLNCSGIYACTMDCSGANCDSGCVAQGTTAGVAGYNTLLSCLDTQCPGLPGGGGVCDSTSMTYSATACDQCQVNAISSAGPCSQQWISCQHD